MTSHELASVMNAYSLGPCTIDAASREVRFGEAVEAVAPRVFDVLLYLVEHRDRVVPKDELLEAVWGKVVVSESVIARTIMKARRAIQDSGDEPRFIKTVQRVGYRFVAPEGFAAVPRQLVEETGLAAPAQRSAACRIALMPIDNRTGDEQLDWISLGLLSLVNQALAKDPRLLVIPVATVLSVHKPLVAQQAPIERQVQALHAALGTDWVVSSMVTRDAEGMTLDFRLAEASGVSQAGFVRWTEPTELGARFARAIEARLLPGNTATASLEFEDPLANQAFARAMQKIEQGKFKAARQLLDVVLEIEPTNLAVRSEYLRSLWQLMDSGAAAFGEHLLADAIVAGDVRQIATTHAVLSLSYHSIEGCGARTRHHAERALLLVGTERPEEWAARVRELVTYYAGKIGDLALVDTLIRHTIQVSEQAGNRVRWCLAMGNLGAVQHRRGQWTLAHSSTAQAIAGLEISYNDLYVAFYRCNLATIECDMGQPIRGLAHADAVLETMRLNPSWRDATNVLWQLCGLYEDIGNLRKIEDAIELIAVAARSASSPSEAYALAIRGQGLACAGDLAAAVELCERATQSAIAANDTYPASRFGAQLLNTLMRRHLYTEARERADRLLAVPQLQTNSSLRLMREHAVALECHRKADVADALHALDRARGEMSDGPWPVYVRLDACWLELERHDVARARGLLDETYSWPDEHPRGMAVKARLLFEERRFDEAQDLLARAVGMQPRYADDVAGQLDIYRRAAAGEVVGMPPVRRLPSVW